MDLKKRSEFIEIIIWEKVAHDKQTKGHTVKVVAHADNQQWATSYQKVYKNNTITTILFLFFSAE